MRRGICVLLLVCAAFLPACSTSPKAPDPKPPEPVSSPPPDDAESPADSSRPNPRLKAAVESMIVGAMVGTMIVPGLGTAVGALGLGIYGAMTGDVPLSGDSSEPRSGSEAEAEDEMDREIEGDVAKQDELEAEIEAELKRQEELLKQIERDEIVREAEERTQAAQDSAALSTDERDAPTAPRPRELPASIFDEKPRQVPKGEWGNEKALEVVAKSLDADRDGAPEEVRYFDQKTGQLVRHEVDSDYDGRIDSWTRYEAGIPIEIQRDTDGNGKLDEWQVYGRDGRMARREVDRQEDGNRDALFLYEGGSLVEERHDANSDGKIDGVVHYERRTRVQSEEDLDRDGRMDTWTHYAGAGGEEVIARVERDANADGKTDTFETYEQVSGKARLTQREEDKNGDGTIDIRSVYENGKLKQREISDPTLAPL